MENKIKILTKRRSLQWLWDLSTLTINTGSQRSSWACLGRECVLFVCLLKTNCSKMKRNGRLKSSRQSQKLDNCSLYEGKRRKSGWKVEKCIISLLWNQQRSSSSSMKMDICLLWHYPFLQCWHFLEPFSVDFSQKVLMSMVFFSQSRCMLLVMFHGGVTGATVWLEIRRKTEVLAVQILLQLSLLLCPWAQHLPPHCKFKSMLRGDRRGPMVQICCNASASSLQPAHHHQCL